MNITSGGSKWRYAGAFFRLNYAYDERYLLEVNGRYDGTSKFPNNSQWGFFPSASAAWRISQEPWWNVNSKAISNLKFRASYGELGNGNVSPYSYLEKFSFSTMGTGSGSTARILDGSALLRYTSAPSQIPDNIGWERSRTFDVGLDAGFYNGKINLSADYYVRKTLDMYTVGPTLPNTFGADSPKGNYADMSTYGFEVSLSYDDTYMVGGKPFNFGIKATLADYYSIIDRYNNATMKLSDYYVGQRLGEIWGFVSHGLFGSQEEIDNAWTDANGNKIPYTNTLMQTHEKYITYPGDIKFEDLNGNNKIDKGADTVNDSGDRTIIGNKEPRYIYSLNLNLEWNGIYASAFFRGVGKQDWYPSNESPFWGQYNRPYNQALKWMVGNYWTEDNPDAYLPRYAGYYAPFYKGSNNMNNRYLMDVSYIRLQNLQVGYNLPKKWVNKIKLANVSVYFSGENLWTWSPMYKLTKDWDVVTVTKKSDTDIDNGRGDGFNYPAMKSFSFGISITY
jgi:TonB-linked SusC/RagA family outer membrane protein